MIDKLVYDLFLADCDQYLSSGETKLLRYYCGIDTGQPPLDAVRIGVMLGRRPEEIKQLTRRALLKLPYQRLQDLKGILAAADHPYAKGLRPSEREALSRLVNTAITLHDAMRKIQQHISSTKAGSPTPPAPTANSSARPVTPKTRPVDRLVQLLEEADTPLTIDQIVRLARERGWAITQDQVKNLLKNSSQIVWYDKHVALLRRWHNRINVAGKQQLRLCPPLPLSPKAPAEQLLGLLLRAKQWLSESHMTYHDLWQQVEREVRLGVAPQDILDLFYACGLTPDVQHTTNRRSYAELVLVDNLSVPAFRAVVLSHVLERIYQLTRTLSAIAHSYQPTLEYVAAQTHGAALGVADTAQRIRLLQALGAVTNREPWEITSIGEQALAAHQDVPVIPPAPMVNPTESTEDDLDWFDL
ncbi:MAG: hypothetical protein SNJ54_01875 [Anaerolineae bacterium]